jgi:hypothetical protein
MTMFASQDPWQSPSAPIPQQSGSNTKPLAIASVVIGILSLPLMFCCSCMGLPLPLIGLGLGGYALFEVRKVGGDQTLAVVGTVLNGLCLVLFALMFVIAIAKQDFNRFDEIMSPEVMEELQVVPDTPEVPAVPETPETPEVPGNE